MKRIISLMLSLVIILSLVCGAVPAVSAASAMKTSDQGIAMLKNFEGFVKWPQMDNGQWTVGYGTAVSGTRLEYYNENGITEAQATLLLKEYLEGFEKSVNTFIDTHSLKLNQQQFDALVSFTYNLGSSWMQSAGTFRTAVINGTTGNEFIYAMAQFGKAGGAPVGGLIERRLCEANLYLNGAYGTTPPANYKYVIYDGNLAGVVPTVTIQGYDSNKSTAVKSTVAGKTGYRFLGWYTTADEGGACITELGSKSAGSTKLYARWQNGEGPKNDDGSIKGIAVSYSGYSANGKERGIYNAPCGEKKSTYKADEKVTVTAEYMDSTGKKWGKISKGWIDVSNGLAALPVYEKTGSAIDPITVTVTMGGVNNRVGPGTNYAKNGTYYKGQQLLLTAVQQGGNYKWGKSEQGWIALQYTDYETSKIQNDANAEKVTAIGTVIRANYVNVRAGAGTKYAKIGTYQRNDEVKISLQQKVGNVKWGLTEKGWISLYYVKMTEVKPGTVPDMDLSGSTVDGSGTVDGSSNGSTTVISSGRVFNCDVLRIRAAAGTGNAHVGDYANGTYVDIYETTTVRSEIWGRTDKGWISMRYVKLDAPTTGAGVTGRIFRTSSVNVRSGAGTHYPKVATLTKGTKVEILDYVKVGNATWGRTSQGWVSLYYVNLDTPLSNLDNGASDFVPAETLPPEETLPPQEATKYTITAVAATNGIVTANVASAAQGDQVTLTVSPNAGYALDTLTVKNASGAAVTVTNNKFTMPASNVTITATFKVQYTVKINASENGKVIANSTGVAPNTEVILTAVPDAGYELDTLSVVNIATNAAVTVANNKFIMPAANVNVVATFKEAGAKTYKITAEEGVSVSTTSAKAGDTVTVTATPVAGKVFDSVTVKTAKNETVTLSAVSGKLNTFSFTMPASNVTAAASFSAASYSVSITNKTATAGTVSVNPDKYESGATVTLLVEAKAEYEVKTLVVKAGDTVIETTKVGKNYTFTMPGQNVTVESSFGKILYPLNITVIGSGTLTADKEAYAKNETVTLSSTPATGYSRGEMSIKTGETDVTYTKDKWIYTFKMPGAAVDVVHTFDKIMYDLTINTNSYGVITADKEQYGYEDVVTLTVTPRAGYKMKAIAAKNGSTKIELKEEGGKYTFAMPVPADKVVVSATYEMIPAKYKVTNTGGTLVNIRADYNASSADLGDIPNDTIIEAVAESPDAKWVKVTYEGITGWVLLENLTKVTG